MAVPPPRRRPGRGPADGPRSCWVARTWTGATATPQTASRAGPACPAMPLSGPVGTVFASPVRMPPPADPGGQPALSGSGVARSAPAPSLSAARDWRETAMAVAR